MYIIKHNVSNICWNDIALHLDFSDVFPEVDVMFENN